MLDLVLPRPQAFVLGLLLVAALLDVVRRVQPCDDGVADGADPDVAADLPRHREGRVPEREARSTEKREEKEEEDERIERP